MIVQLNNEDRESFRRWCTRRLGATIELRYRPAGTRGVVLAEVRLEEATIDELMATALRDSSNRPSGRVRYEWRDVDPSTGRVRDTWSASWHSSAQDEHEQDESSHLDGSALALVRQAQRWAEGSLKVALGNTQQLLQLQSDALAQAHDTIARLSAENANLRAKDDDRTARQHEHELAIVKSADEQTRRASMWESFRLWVPAALAQINGGRSVLPGTATANELVAYELLRSMNDEQLKTWMMTLRPEQQASVMTLLQKAIPVVAPHENATAGDSAET